MEDYTTRVELMAIPITLVVVGIGVVLLLAGASRALGVGDPRRVGRRARQPPDLDLLAS